MFKKLQNISIMNYNYGKLIHVGNPTTHIDVPAGQGAIIDGQTDRSHISGFEINWLDITIDLTSYFTDPIGVVTIYVTPNLADLAISTVNVIQGIASTTLYRGNVMLGHVFYHASIIDQVLNSPIQANEVGLTLYDFIEYNTPEENTRGVNIQPITGAISIWCESGTVFHIGGNVDSGDLTNPNILPFPALGDSVTLEPFEIHLQDGSTYLAAQTVMPEVYESAPGVVSALAGNEAVIHYVFRSAGGELILQLGQSIYSNGKVARDSLDVDKTGYTMFTGSASTLFRAQIYLQRTATDFSDSTMAGIVNIGGSGGGGTVTAVSDFIDLTDVLVCTYAGSCDYIIAVNAAETGVVAVDISTTYVDVAGDIMTGDLFIRPTSGLSQLIVNSLTGGNGIGFQADATGYIRVVATSSAGVVTDSIFQTLKTPGADVDFLTRQVSVGIAAPTAADHLTRMDSV